MCLYNLRTPHPPSSWICCLVSVPTRGDTNEPKDSPGECYLLRVTFETAEALKRNWHATIVKKFRISEKHWKSLHLCPKACRKGKRQSILRLMHVSIDVFLLTGSSDLHRTWSWPPFCGTLFNMSLWLESLGEFCLTSGMENTSKSVKF